MDLKSLSELSKTKKVDALAVFQDELHSRLKDLTGLEWKTLIVDLRGHGVGTVKLNGRLIFELSVLLKNSKVTLSSYNMKVSTKEPLYIIIQSICEDCINYANENR